MEMINYGNGMTIPVTIKRNEQYNWMMISTYIEGLNGAIKEMAEIKAQANKSKTREDYIVELEERYKEKLRGFI